MKKTKYLKVILSRPLKPRKVGHLIDIEDEWKVWQNYMNQLSLKTQIMCREAGAIVLSQNWPEGHGISGSDVNHKMFGIWKHECDKDFTKYIGRCYQITEEEN